MGGCQSSLASPGDSHSNAPGVTEKATTNLLDSKIVVLGDSGVGKSSLSLRFAQGAFPRTHEVTVGAAFLQNFVKMADSSLHKLQIWDSGGSERFRAMAPLYYRDAWGCLLVFDVTEPKSFDSMSYWLGELRVKGPEHCVVFVVANKTDLPASVDLKAVEAFCAKEGVKFFQASAFSGQGVNAVFTNLAEDILRKKKSLSYRLLRCFVKTVKSKVTFMQSAVSERTRKILINVGGFGLGLLWVVMDEMENPKIFRIPQAEQFSHDELTKWNTNAGPKGPWAVGDEELDRMKFRPEQSEPVEPRHSSW